MEAAVIHFRDDYDVRRTCPRRPRREAGARPASVGPSQPDRSTDQRKHAREHSPRPGPLTVYTSNDGKGRAVEGTDFKMRLEGHRHAVGIKAAN